MGGNIVNASPAADGVAGPDGLRRVVCSSRGAAGKKSGLDRFYSRLQGDEAPSGPAGRGIRIPRRRYAYQVFREGRGAAAQAIAKVGLAVTRSDAGWRVVAASVAPTIAAARRRADCSKETGAARGSR